MKKIRNIYVYMDCFEEKPILMGILHSELLRGKEVFSFEYDSTWLILNLFRNIDPDLLQYSGKQYLPNGKSKFGLFLDSSPDRWGRMLMRRRESINAKREKRNPFTLTETDYLLGVYDGNRMGALRFKLSPDSDFLDNNKALATPPWTSLRDLEYASLQIENDNIKDDIEYAKWLNMLIAPGSSLGGARPKANIIDNQANLWIAKFPSSHDNRDMGAWEALTAELAKKCGIQMAECSAQKFNSKQHTFLTKRFDRKGKKRIHFASAMTLLGYTDGVDAAEGISYLELVEWIGRNCENVSQNLEQLYKRIIFNIAVSNCDDHLRNHGFILGAKGWELSPAYDINPDPNGMGLKLNISEDDNSLDFNLAIGVAKYFGIEENAAENIINHTKSVVSTWKTIATSYGLSRTEQEDMASAFNS
ncbi:MAG: HipA domain-containing protein [Bacteroides sp.]|nr:HipA domain-containing protein [Bacteroides sp.]